MRKFCEWLSYIDTEGLTSDQTWEMRYATIWYLTSISFLSIVDGSWKLLCWLVFNPLLGEDFGMLRFPFLFVSLLEFSSAWKRLFIKISLATACDAISSGQLPTAELFFCDDGFGKESISFAIPFDDRGWNSSPSANSPEVDLGDNVVGIDNGCGRNCWGASGCRLFRCFEALLLLLSSILPAPIFSSVRLGAVELLDEIGYGWWDLDWKAREEGAFPFCAFESFCCDCCWFKTIERLFRSWCRASWFWGVFVPLEEVPIAIWPPFGYGKELMPLSWLRFGFAWDL